MQQTSKQDQQKLDERHHTHTLKYPPTSDAQGGACKGKGVGCTFAIPTRKYPSFTAMEICRWESGFGVAAVLGTVQVKVCRCQRISKEDPQARRGNKKSKQEEHFVLTGFRIYVLCFRGSDPLYIGSLPFRKRSKGICYKQVDIGVKRTWRKLKSWICRWKQVGKEPGKSWK